MKDNPQEVEGKEINGYKVIKLIGIFLRRTRKVLICFQRRKNSGRSPSGTQVHQGYY